MKKIVLFWITILLITLITGCTLEQQELTPEMSDINGKVYNFISLTDTTSHSEFMLNQEKQIDFLTGLWKETHIKNYNEFKDFENVTNEIKKLSGKCGGVSEIVKEFESRENQFKIDVSDIKILNTEIKNNTAFVSVKYNYNSEKVNTKFRLEKINKTWYIADKTRESLGGAWITSLMKEEDEQSSLSLSTESLRTSLKEIRRDCGITNKELSESKPNLEESKKLCNIDSIGTVKSPISLELAPDFYNEKDSWGENVIEWSNRNFISSKKLNNDNWEITTYQNKEENKETQKYEPLENVEKYQELLKQSWHVSNLGISEYESIDLNQVKEIFYEDYVIAIYELYRFEDQTIAQENFNNILTKDGQKRTSQTKIEDGTNIGDEYYIYNIKEDGASFSWDRKEDLTDYDRNILVFRSENIVGKIIYADGKFNLNNIDDVVINADVQALKKLGNNLIEGLCQINNGEINANNNIEESDNDPIEQKESELIKLSGEGQTATDLFHLKEGLAIFNADHVGKSNFIVRLLDENGNNVGSSLFNEIGNVKGSVAMNIKEDGNYLLNLKADGSWNFFIEQPRLITAPYTKTFTGSGKKSSELFYLDSGLKIFNLEHVGKSNFIVRLLDENGNNVGSSLVNEIGNFDGSDAIQIRNSGIYLLNINADGDWKIEIK